MTDKEVPEERKTADYNWHEKIDRMNSIALRRLIKSTEDSSVTEEERKYAESRLPEVVEKEKALRAERSAEKKEQKRLKAEEKEKRKAELAAIGNDRIRALIYEEYVPLCRKLQPTLTDERREEKLLKVRRALWKIDFTEGIFHSGYYGDLSVDIEYLTDRNVLLFNGFAHDCYVYLPCKENTRLSLISSYSLRDPDFYYSQKFWERTLMYLKKEYWTPVFSPFPRDFLHSFLSKYYLNYTERTSEGKETTHIPKFDS